MSTIETRIIIESNESEKLRVYAEMLVKFADIEDNKKNITNDEKTNVAIAEIMPSSLNESTLAPYYEMRNKTPAEIFVDFDPATAGEDKSVRVTKQSDDSYSSEELDVDGLPWDSRVHSRTKSKTKDGRWKTQRRLDKTEPQSASSTPSAPNNIAQVSAPIMPPPPVDQRQVILPPPAPAEPVNAYVAFIPKVTKLISDKRLTGPKLIEILNSHGVANIPELNKHHDLIPIIEAELMELTGIAI